MSSMPTLRIALLLGGRSSEREVSLKTGEAIAAALQRLGHTTIKIDPDEDLFEELKRSEPDLVYNALHGTEGEDGVIQGILQWLKLPYTGSNLTSSALAMDKSLSRILFAQAGVPIASGAVWRRGEAVPSLNQIPPPPWIFKPASEGSSVGLHACDTFEDLTEALLSKTEVDPDTWLIEERVYGTEISVVVCEGEVWGGVEIAPSSGMYDYEAKYKRQDTQYYCPPRIASELQERVEGYAAQAYRALGCSGVARVDFIVSSQRIIALELNTLPGMTETSLVPKVARAFGLSFDQVIERTIQLALKQE